MQNAVLRHFPDAEVVIRFTNRAPEMRFTRECFDWIVERVNRAYTSALSRERTDERIRALTRRRSLKTRNLRGGSSRVNSADKVLDSAELHGRTLLSSG